VERSLPFRPGIRSFASEFSRSSSFAGQITPQPSNLTSWRPANKLIHKPLRRHAALPAPVGRPLLFSGLVGQIPIPSPANWTTRHGRLGSRQPNGARFASIVSTFRKRLAGALQSGRSFVIPDQKDQASGTTDFELVTWLVIKKP
jgi:hypothetical protein